MFLITRPPEFITPTLVSGQTKATGLKVMVHAMSRLYAEGGILGFWVGNGLSVAKIFPESAIKFFTYESTVSPISLPFLIAVRQFFPFFVVETDICQVCG